MFSSFTLLFIFGSEGTIQSAPSVIELNNLLQKYQNAKPAKKCGQTPFLRFTSPSLTYTYSNTNTNTNANKNEPQRHTHSLTHTPPPLKTKI